MYGLRSSPKALQDYFATSIEEPGFRRLLSEANVYANSANDVYIMVYVDDVRVTGDPSKVNKIFETIQEKMLLKRTGYLDLGGNPTTSSADRSTTKETTLTSSLKTATSKQYFKKSTWPNAIQHLRQVQQQTHLHVQNHSPRTNTRSTNESE